MMGPPLYYDITTRLLVFMYHSMILTVHELFLIRQIFHGFNQLFIDTAPKTHW